MAEELSSQLTMYHFNRNRLVWAAVISMIVLAVLSLLNLALLEFGPWRHNAIQVDELYFASCAVRGLVAGEVPIAGCHDSKAPLIFAVHQLVQLGPSPYSLLAIKAAAFGVVVVVTVLAALIAFRLAGAMAAAVAAALLLLALTADAQSLALKTETVGGVFMLIGANFLIGSHRRYWSWLGSGFFLGLAVAAKQTFVFAALAVVVWSWFSTPGESVSRRLRSFLLNMFSFGVGLIAPLAAFLLVFFLQGRHIEYLASLFLYPTIYGGGQAAPWIKASAWRAASVLESLGKFPILVASLAAATAGSIQNWNQDRTNVGPSLKGRRLVVSMTLAMLLVTFVSPIYFAYHLVPSWILMAVLGGIVIGELGEMSLDGPPRAARFLAAGLVTFALVSAATSWYSNGGRNKAVKLDRPEAFIKDGHGQYAYVLGMWPSFYVYNDLVPASRVLFPWALPGTPGNWAYKPPDSNSVRGHVLAWVHSANLRQLFEDFRRTPPKYIVVSHDIARYADSTRVADVPGFDAYLLEHCVYIGAAPENLSSAQSLYDCRGGNIDGSLSPGKWGEK